MEKNWQAREGKDVGDDKVSFDFPQNIIRYSALKYLQKRISDYCEKLPKSFDSTAGWNGYRDSVIGMLRTRFTAIEQTEACPNFTTARVSLGSELELEAVDVHFDEGFYIPVHIYRKKGIPKPAPAVMVCHGYGQAKNARDIADICIALASRGITAAAADYDASGERADRPDVHTDVNNVSVLGQLLGITNVQLRVLNNIAVLNYLKKCEDIDSKRIGITGLCQGAIVTWFTAALCEELSAIALVCGVTTYEAIALEYCNRQGGWTGISPYEYDILRYADVQHIIGTFAPRPLLAQNNIIDMHWPLSGFQKVRQFVEHIYGLYDARDKVSFRLEHGPHAYEGPFLENVVEWFSENL